MKGRNENIASKTGPHRWQKDFLRMLPKIEKQLVRAFRRLDPEAREEAVQEGIVNCLIAFRRLVQRKKRRMASPTALAQYAIKHIKSGRVTGSRLNVNNPLSRYAQLRKRIHVTSLDRRQRETGEWVSAMAEDRRTPIPEQVAFRIDVPAWLATLSRRERRIIKQLSNGDPAGRVARRFRISDARISQIRRGLFESWHRFHGLDASPVPA